jgi:hypothetical protein
LFCNSWYIHAACFCSAIFLRFSIAVCMAREALQSS